MVGAVLGSFVLVWIDVAGTALASSSPCRDLGQMAIVADRGHLTHLIPLGPALPAASTQVSPIEALALPLDVEDLLSAATRYALLLETSIVAVSLASFYFGIDMGEDIRLPRRPSPPAFSGFIGALLVCSIICPSMACLARPSVPSAWPMARSDTVAQSRANQLHWHSNHLRRHPHYHDGGCCRIDAVRDRLTEVDSTRPYDLVAAAILSNLGERC